MIKPHIAAYLDSKGVAWHPHVHPRRYTAQEIAAVEHVRGRRFAKTVVLELDGRLAMAVLGAHREVDLGRLARALGSGVRLADEAQFADRFHDCDVGAMPPLGELYGMEVLVDAELAREPNIVFNGGTHEDSIEMTTQDFGNLAAVRILDFARPAQRAAA